MHPRIVFLTVLLAVATAGLAGCGGGGGGGEPQPNIVILMVDALRADHLGCYGYDRDTSPFLDEFAQQGVLFERAYAQSSQTKLSVASLMSGLNPPSHHVRSAELPDITGEAALTDVLSEELETLAERLRTAGYATAGFVTNPHLAEGQGFDQGFDHYAYQESAHCMADRLNDDVLGWLAANETSPYFLYVHYMDVHAPYRAPRPYRFLYGRAGKNLKTLEFNGPPTGPVTLERIGHTIDMYDGQINYWDDRFQELVTALSANGTLENTIVVVVADHGDEFYENGGFGHGYTVYDGVIRVPLIVVGAPGQVAGTHRADPVRLTDLLPTLCRLAGAPADEALLDGSDFFAAGRAEGGAAIQVYAEAPLGNMPRSVRKGDGFLVFNEAKSSYEYYDLVNDPFQQVNAWGTRRPELGDLRADLERLQAGLGLIEKPQQGELSPGTVEALKSLGY